MLYALCYNFNIPANANVLKENKKLFRQKSEALFLKHLEQHTKKKSWAIVKKLKNSKSTEGRKKNTKPFLQSEDLLYPLSISHSHNKVLFFYSLAPILKLKNSLSISKNILSLGCDIEHNSNVKKPIKMAKRYFHPNELSLIDTIDDFIFLWSIKESFYKAYYDSDSDNDSYTLLDVIGLDFSALFNTYKHSLCDTDIERLNTISKDKHSIVFYLKLSAITNDDDIGLNHIYFAQVDIDIDINVDAECDIIDIKKNKLKLKLKLKLNKNKNDKFCFVQL